MTECRLAAILVADVVSFSRLVGADGTGTLARLKADALVAADAPGEQIAGVISEARELVRKSGSNSLLPRLREAEARIVGRKDHSLLLAGRGEAEAIYRAMGAPDPADRPANELS
jgi:hypothetical protein